MAMSVTLTVLLLTLENMKLILAISGILKIPFNE